MLKAKDSGRFVFSFVIPPMRDEGSSFLDWDDVREIELLLDSDVLGIESVVINESFQSIGEEGHFLGQLKLLKNITKLE